MNNLFLTLCLFSLLGLIIAIINPSAFNRITKKETTRKQASLFFTGAVILFFVLFGITAPDLQENNLSIEEKEEIEAIFNFESLYGKNIDEIKNILGEPIWDKEPEDVQVNIKSEDQLSKEWAKTWEKNGYKLTASYHVASREIIDFFVETDDPSGSTKNIKKLEEIIGAKKLINFTTQPVKVINNPNAYTGIMIIPKNN